MATTFGTISVSKQHILAEAPGGFRMSAYLQEKVAYLGQKEVYQEASDSLLMLAGLSVSGKQIERVSHRSPL